MKKEIKDFKKDNAGRSMTEMLGVLAIIGVLSLGGIIGYKLAMNRYAANQIAYEINMMKTDAKVKIMQGNDTLTLGQPYDGDSDYLGHLNYNEAYTVDFDCVWAGDKFIDEAETCQVANAYYIELQHIPEGICKPLANLIENMNDLIAFDINLTESEEGRVGGDCEEGENVLNAVFSAEPGDLDVLKCEKNEDCPTGLQCHNHLCVECTEDTDCGKTGYCENNACEYCESGVWDSATKQCVDCLEKNDCKDNPNGEVCENNKCVQCMEDKDCPNKTTAPHCDPETHTCGPCPNYWSNELNKCVECTADDHCLDKNTNPVCNKDTGECGPCPNGQTWQTTVQKCGVGECESNDDCKSLGEGYYCHLFAGYTCEQEFDSSKGFGAGYGSYTSKCQKVNDDLTNQTTIGNKIYYGSNITMTWWSACRICAAKTGNDESVCASPTKAEPFFMSGYDMLECADPIDIDINKEIGYCHETKVEDTNYHPDNISNVITNVLRKMYKSENYILYLRDSNSSCLAYGLHLDTGRVGNHAGRDEKGLVTYAFCEDLLSH